MQAIGDAVGVTPNRVLQLVRAVGHSQPGVAPASWITTGEAAAHLGVGRKRLERHGAAGEQAEVARMFGWDRRWRVDQLDQWWASNRMKRSPTGVLPATSRSASCSPAVRPDRPSPTGSESTCGLSTRCQV